MNRYQRNKAITRQLIEGMAERRAFISKIYTKRIWIDDVLLIVDIDGNIRCEYPGRGI